MTLAYALLVVGALMVAAALVLAGWLAAGLAGAAWCLGGSGCALVGAALAIDFERSG